MSEKTTRPVSPFHVLLENCTVSKNAIVLSEDDVVIGQGSLFTHSVPVIFKGTVLFEDNTNMSALVLDNTVLKVHDICIFRNNSGQSGGAIALYGESQIMTMKNSTLVFANNTASVKGGAIYVQTPGPPLAAFETRKLAIYQCFLAHENLSIEDVEYWLTNISFINNLASGWGNSVYATTLQSCFKRNDTRLNNSALLWPVVHFLPKDFQQHIGTAPVFINVTTSDWFVAPSQWFNTSVHLRNERNEPCNGTIQIDVKSGQSTSDDVELNEPSPLFLIPQNGTIPNIRLKGKPKSNFTVSFKTLQGQLIQHTIDSTLKPCWPGYKQSDDKKACKCLDKDKYPGMLRCGDNNKDVYLKSGFWFGNVSEQNIKVYSTFSCPEHYCRNHTNRTGFFEGFLYEEKRMCSENRTGILCGQCKNGTNLLLGSDDCRVEKKHDKLYAALVLLGFAVGAVFLILFLLLFDLGIFIKYFSCWLFSYQVMEFLKYEGDDLDPVITAVIEIPNWRIPGIGMCIIPGMNDLQKLGFNYLLPLYILGVLLVLGIISEKRPQCYYNRNGARILPGCCVLLILCYTNVISISFKIFHWVHLPTEFNSTWVLFVDGNISPEYCKHDFWCISLSVIAALGFIFLIPIPIVLSLRPPVIRNYRTIRHLCSIFQECFQEGKEWFASVYFFLRIVVIIIAMFMPAGAYTPLKRITLDILTVIILVTFVHLKPYNERYSELNKLDAFLLGHLCLFTLLCSNRGNESTKYMQEILWYFIDVLAYVPLLYLICILSYLSYIKRAILANHWVTFRQKLFDIFCQCRDVERNLENLLDQEATTTETSEDD